MSKKKVLIVLFWLFLVPYINSEKTVSNNISKEEQNKSLEFRVEKATESLSCQLFPAENIWNTPVNTLPVDSNSARYINTIGADATVHADFGSGLWEGEPIGIPFTTVPGTQAKVNVTFYWADESDPGPYPIPADAPIEGGSDSDGDRHVLIVDRDNCILYELYYAFPQPDGSWTAGSGAIYDLNSNDLRPAGWTSADAAGLPILPGLVGYEEVAAGEINHAIRFTAHQTRKKYIWPARHYASDFTGTEYPPMGQRFRLKADFDISGFSIEVQVILKALKKYGMILADNGSRWFISGVPDERWDNDVLHELHNVQGSDFEAVDESSLMIDPDSGEALQSGSTAVISISRSQLNFGASVSGAATDSQTFSIENNGTGTLNWMVSDNSNWLSCTPSSGTDLGIVTVSVDASGLSPNEYNGRITVSSPDASNSPQTLTVYLNVYPSGSDSEPFGSFDSPAQGSTVRSSIPVTGWALDDIGVERVRIYREAGSEFEPIGDAIFVEGARPDIESAYPDYPMNSKGGWGYMMLTNFLPDGGNGTFTLHAIARDSTGHEVTLGTRTITCDNANAVKPFGAIDTPDQGGTASGSSYINWGWVLTPQSNSIPTDGSTINVFVNGVNLGNPTYNRYREDIASLFPGYANSNGAIGFFYLDTTSYESGVHTIQWTAADDAGNKDGIGSRYFVVDNSHSAWRRALGVGCFSQIPFDYSQPVRFKKGYDPNANPVELYPNDKGELNIEIKELERLEIHLENSNSKFKIQNSKLKNDSSNLYGGYLLVNDCLRSLPVGSTFDSRRGLFYWQPGPGFIGEYKLIFTAKKQTEGIKMMELRIKIVPKFEKK